MVKGEIEDVGAVDIVTEVVKLITAGIEDEEKASSGDPQVVFDCVDK